MSAVLQPVADPGGAGATQDLFVWTDDRKATLRQFLADVLPRTGLLVLAEKTQRGMPHHWHADADALTAHCMALVDTPDVYVGAASFRAKEGGRTAENVTRLRAHRIDIDVGPGKKFGDAERAATALVEFIERSGLTPTYIVSSGGGLHVWWCLSEDVSAAEWKPVAETLKAATGQALHADPAVTADPTRIMRWPGSINAKRGKRAKVLKRFDTFYAHDQFAGLVARLIPAPTQDVAFPAGTGARSIGARLALNAEVIVDDFADRPPASFPAIVERCAALKQATAGGGAAVGEPLWRGMLGIVKHCADAERHAHDASRGHAEYDPVETQAKMDRWNAGPTTCTYFEGCAPDACTTCEHRGKIKSPIVLGYVAERTASTPDAEPAQAVAAAAAATVPAPVWLAELNRQYAVVRWGSGVVVLDRQTPCITAAGVHYAGGFLEVAAFRQLLRGRTEVVGGKVVPTADAWLSHPLRAQFAAAVFAPGESLPADVLNLWTGFAFDAKEGDVEPWLKLLEALIPDAVTRHYVLHWLALKVQNPGLVPGTILVCTGAKGSGKNSLFEPVVRMFGAAGRVFDDAEQVAGRFTGHLMTVAFAVLDEALFAGNAQQNDRIKSRVTASTMSFESKGRDAVTGVNRCAYVSLSNHVHVFDATQGERRPVIIETGTSLVGNRSFWDRYHAWMHEDGPAALLDHLLGIDLTGFDVRAIPRTDALRRQVEHTALRNPVVAWWHAVLDEGAVTVYGGGMVRRYQINAAEPTAIDKEALRLSYQETSRERSNWPNASKQLREWTGGLRTVRVRGEAGVRARIVELPPLPELRTAFEAATGVRIDHGGDE